MSKMLCDILIFAFFLSAVRFTSFLRPFPLYSHSLDIPPIESRRLVYLHLAVVRRISFTFLSSHSSFFPPLFFFFISHSLYMATHGGSFSLLSFACLILLSLFVQKRCRSPPSIVLDTNISISFLPFHLRSFPKRFLLLLLSLVLFTFDRVHFPLKLEGVGRFSSGMVFMYSILCP